MPTIKMHDLTDIVLFAYIKFEKYENNDTDI